MQKSQLNYELSLNNTEREPKCSERRLAIVLILLTTMDAHEHMYQRVFFFNPIILTKYRNNALIELPYLCP